MNHRTLLRSFFFLFAGLVGAAGLLGQNAAERIRDRLPEVDALKSAGVVGENNEGFLEARVELAPAQEALVEAENADRRELYRRVARRSDLSVEEVGRQRAVRIAQQARPGVWLQTTKGDWVRKPGEEE
ncbi:MAG: YdbL family protein [Opitutales bacterium]